MTVDLRAAILARCAELRRIALAADEWRPGQWIAEGYTPGDGIVRNRQQDESTGLICVVAEADRRTAPLIATMDPPAVLALVAGAEQMCELHQPTERLLDVDYCGTCGDAPQVEYPCASLVLTAKMIGVTVESGAHA